MWGRMHKMHAFFELPPHKDKFRAAGLPPLCTAESQQDKTKRSLKVHSFGGKGQQSLSQDNTETRTVAIEWSLGLRTFVLDSHQRDVFEWTLSNTRQHCMAGLGGCVCGDWEMIKGYKKGHIHFYTLIYTIV